MKKRFSMNPKKPLKGPAPHVKTPTASLRRIRRWAKSKGETK